MTRHQLLAAALAGAALMGTACGSTSPTPPAGRATLDAVFAGLIARSTDLGPAPSDQTLAITLQLRDDSAAARQAAIEAIYRPGSPTYMHFIDPTQLDAAYGPDPAAVTAAERYLQGSGVDAAWRRGTDFLSTTGTPQRLAATFGVDPHSYRARSGREFIASRLDPVIPAAITGIVVGASHLNTYNPIKPAAAPGGGFKPPQINLAYGLKDLHDQGIDGSGQTVSVYAIGDGYSQADLDTWASKMGLPPIKPVHKSGPKNAKVEGELMMDIEVVHEIAPGAQILVYTDPESTAFKTAQSFQAFFDRMLQDNPNGIWSFSWGACDLETSSTVRGLESAVYAKAAAAGVSVLNSTGDSGAYRCLDADWGAPPSDKYLGVEVPSSYPLGVTAVGGTRLSVRQDGSYYEEIAWSDPLITQGTGGGLSHYYTRPDWQQGPNVSSNQYNPNGRRMVPDVAADADPATGLALYIGGSLGEGGGTSQAAPIWAGLTADINQYLKRKGLKPLGFMNPALYDIAAGRPPYPAFHDVTLGTNLAYPATPGYDLATGLGTPDGYNLARDLEAYQRNGGHV